MLVVIVGLVGCSKTKAAIARPACELYASPLFLYSYRAALRSCDVVRILSARHGLVEPSTVIAPYDTTLRGLSREQSAEWRDSVGAGLRALLAPAPPPHKLVFFAGHTYWLATPQIDGVEQVEPLRGLFIGQRFTKLHAIDAGSFR